MTVEQPPSQTTPESTHPLPSTLLAGAVAAAAAAVIVYAAAGYSTPVVLIWIVAIVTLGVVYESRTARLPRVTWQDVVVPGAIILALAPFYVLNVYEWPVQVGSDEVAIMTSAERWVDRGNPDLFGPSDYFGHPALLFVVWGKLGQLLGGIDLRNLRALHSAVDC